MAAVVALAVVGLFAWAMMRADRRDETRQLEAVRRRLRSRARESSQTSDD